MDIATVRQKFPQYSDMSDTQLADALHSKFYSDMDKGAFYGRIGLKSQPTQSKPASEEGGSAFNRFVDNNPVAGAFVGAGGGLVKAATGAIQGVAQALGADGVAEAAGRSTEQINKNIDNIGTAGKVGGVVGETAPYLLIPGGALTVAGRMVLGAAGGAAQGALQAQENPDGGERVKDAVVGGITGAVAAPVVEKGIDIVRSFGRAGRDVAKGMTAKTAEQWQEVGTGLKQASQQTYKAMRESGAVINKKTVNSLVDDLESAVTANGKTNPDLHRNTLSVLNDLKAIRNKPLSLEEADQYRQLLNDVVSSGTDGTGKINPDAMKALGLIDVLDSHIERLGNSNMVGKVNAESAQLLKQARQEWGRYRRFDKVSSLIERYGDNPGVLKNQVRLLLLNKKATRGFNEQELNALRKLSQKGGVEGWLRLAGRAGIDLRNPSGNIVPLVLGGGATAVGDVATGGLLTGSATAARYASQALTRGQASDALGTLAGLNAGPVAVRPSLSQGARDAIRVTATGASTRGEDDKPTSNVTTMGPAEQQGKNRIPVSPAASGTSDEEGFRPRVYKDTVRKRTVGIGFNMQQPGARRIWEEAGIEVPFNDVLTGRKEISEEQAQKLHDVMMDKAASAAPRLVKGIDNLSDNRQAVIRDMLYQLGEGEAKKFAPTFKLIEKGRFADAAKRLMNAKIASQAPNRVARNAYMLEHNVSREEAEKALVAAGKIKSNGRLYG